MLFTKGLFITVLANFPLSTQSAGWGGGGGERTERQNIAVFKVGDYALGKLKFWFYFTKMCCSLYCVDIPPPLWG